MKARTGSIAISLILAGQAVAVAQNTQQAAAPDWTVPGLELKLKRIPAGKFVMGSPADEMRRRADETPHEVTLSKPFYMGVHEVTQREFYKLMMPPGYDYDAWQYKRGPVADGAAFHFRYPTGKGLIFKDGAVGGKLTDLNPMECVTWERAMEFCAKLTGIEKQAGRLPAGYVFRLPTEAEWEYACRAGTKGPYNVDADFTKVEAIRTFAWVAGDDTAPGPRVVGTRKPNAWGLHDMHGNVYEWCVDWYAPYPQGAVADPSGPATGKERVVRGGCFASVAKKEGTSEKEALDKGIHPFMRSASRYRVRPELGYLGIVGFRVVLAPQIAR